MELTFSLHTFADAIDAELARLERDHVAEPKIRFVLDAPEARKLASKLRRMALLEERL